MPLPYTLHYHDDTDDKPQQISEEDALRVIQNYYVGEAMQEQRWEELQRGEAVFVRAESIYLVCPVSSSDFRSSATTDLGSELGASQVR